MARTIKATILQPVYDADGKLLYQPGEQVAEDHRVLKSIPPGTWRHDVVEAPDPEPKPKAGKVKSEG